MNLTTKLASALLALGDIPHEDAKQMTDQQIISLYQFDHHPIRKHDGGPDAAWNLTPRLIDEHRRKTADVDQPAMSKDRRINRKQRDHDLRMKAKQLGLMCMLGAEFECSLWDDNPHWTVLLSIRQLATEVAANETSNWLREILAIALGTDPANLQRRLHS